MCIRDRGRDKAIAPILTNSVPSNRGISPKIGAGVEVGYHFVAPKNSEGLIVAPDMIFPVKFSDLYCSGKNAIIPGSLWTVSYTHLDVYKRQVSLRSVMRMRSV